MNFFASPNLSSQSVTECAPWDWAPPDELLEKLIRIPKTARKAITSSSATAWNIYSTCRGVIRGQIISKDNPVAALRGWAADYDTQQPVEFITSVLGQLSPELRPQWLEISLGGKCRLVWVFESEMLTVDTQFAESSMAALVGLIGARTLLAGYDSASERANQRWTNGGRWYELSGSPKYFPRDLLQGAALKASTTRPASGQSVKMDIVAAEVEKRWPGRWAGEFRVNATGVRFWDPRADNPRGCQIKEDGVICFTGDSAWLSWGDLFGSAWVKETTARSMADMVDGIYFDKRNYWRPNGTTWSVATRESLRGDLRCRGVSDVRRKGETATQMDEVLRYIELKHEVDGVGPMVNYPSGIVEYRGGRILNTSRLVFLAPSSDPDPARWPWLGRFLPGLFGDELAHHTFLHWLQRAYVSARMYRASVGQCLFLCGPRATGKTLLAEKVVGGLLGSRTESPYSFFVGGTDFNGELFESFLWTINDEEAPKDEVARQRFLQRVKAAVVNGAFPYQPKFCNKIRLEWMGRMIMTLNDDAMALRFLPESNSNTQDKLSFFRAHLYTCEWPYNDEWVKEGKRPLDPGEWPERHEMEAVLARELPHFAAWLLAWKPPETVTARGTREIVRSYFDPGLLRISREHMSSYDLAELIHLWADYCDYSEDEWEGTASALMAAFAAVAELDRLLVGWTAGKVASSLTTLSRMPGSGVTLLDGRRFKVAVKRVQHG